MIDCGLYAELVKKLYAADTENNLLVDAHVLVTAIDSATDITIMGFIGCNVGIKQVKCCSAYFEAPCLGINLALGYIDRNDKVIAFRVFDFFYRQVLRVLKGIVFLLPAVLIEVLSEITFFVK